MVTPGVARAAEPAHDSPPKPSSRIQELPTPAIRDLSVALVHDALRGSISPAKKNRNRPVSRISCCPGSSSTVTPK